MSVSRRALPLWSCLRQTCSRCKPLHDATSSPSALPSQLLAFNSLHTSATNAADRAVRNKRSAEAGGSRDRSLRSSRYSGPSTLRPALFTATASRPHGRNSSDPTKRRDRSAPVAPRRAPRDTITQAASASRTRSMRTSTAPPPRRDGAERPRDTTSRPRTGSYPRRSLTSIRKDERSRVALERPRSGSFAGRQSAAGGRLAGSERGQTSTGRTPFRDFRPDNNRDQSGREKPANSSIRQSAPRTRPDNDTSQPEEDRKFYREDWMARKADIKAKLKGEAWNPSHRLSPDTIEGIRALHAQYPEQFTTPILAQEFKVNTEAIRRILKSNFRPSGKLEEDVKNRWERRGEKIWGALVASGARAPKKWRQRGIGSGPRSESKRLSRERNFGVPFETAGRTSD